MTTNHAKSVVKRLGVMGPKFLLPFYSSAVNISKLARGKHTVAIAKSMVGSVKNIDIMFGILCQPSPKLAT